MANLIYKQFVFGRLRENGSIEYFVPQGGYLVYTEERDGKTVKIKARNPTEAQMNQAGWYRVVNVEEDGTDVVIDNILYHYIGVPYVEEDPVIEEEPTEE